MSGRVVSDIQTRAEGESLYIWYNTDANVVNDLWNSLVLWIFWRSNFENTSYITRENQSYSLCKSTKICIAYTDAFTLMISFVFSSWIINEFHNFKLTGKIYLSFEACSSIRVESLPMNIPLAPSDLTKTQENPAIGSQRIMDYYNFQRCDKVMCTLSYILCRIVAVQKVALQWTCSKCGRLPRSCYCYVSGTNQAWICSAQAR